jgi:hypothetical protein
MGDSSEITKRASADFSKGWDVMCAP